MKILLSAVLLALAFNQPASKQQPNPQNHKESEKQLLTPSIESPTPSQPNLDIKQSCASNEPKKSYFQWLIEPLVANWPLIAVAIWGILVAAKTLKSIDKQANLMDGQLREMVESRKLQTKLLILQYRPKIVVRNAKAVEFNFKLGEPGEGKVEFTIVNAGGSTARITKGTVALCSSIGHDVGKIETMLGDVSSINTFTLQPGEDARVTSLLSTGTKNDIQWANFHAGIKDKPLLFISFVGEIRYVDDLGIPRQTGVNRAYDPKTKEFIPTNTEQEYTD